jgi:putative ABC transport system substrate-binding protein
MMRAAAMKRKHLPAIYPLSVFVEHGGMMSYGVNLDALWRRAPVFIDKILRGARPADLPLEQPSRYELVISVKTVLELGLTVLPSMLARADEVIQ